MNPPARKTRPTKARPRRTRAACNVPNRTIFCHDNLEIMQGINDACIDLIYLDPPFNKNKTFTAPIGSTAKRASFKDIFREEDLKEEWLETIEEYQPLGSLYHFLDATRESGKSSNFAYLAYMAVRLIECRRILKPTGSIYLHCDPTMSHHLKLLMDTIFGEDNFRNEIIWNRSTASGGKAGAQKFVAVHDTIFCYAASKQYFDESRGEPVSDIWTDIFPVNPMAKERTGYPTQKPLALLDRIISASSNVGDIVLDPFCGCAPTCIAAENADRQWIGIDVSHDASDLVKERLKKEVDKDQRDWVAGPSRVSVEVEPPERTDLGAGYREKRFVYVISHPQYPGEYKVGIAKNVESRVGSFRTSASDRRYRVEFKKETHLFRETEAHIHATFPNKHEWVEGDLKEIIRAIRSYKPQPLAKSARKVAARSRK